MTSSQGLVAALGGKFPDTEVLLDDWFDHGQCGWHQLYDSNVPRGVLGLTNMPAMRERSLVLQTTDQQNGASTSYPWGLATALKRTFRPQADLSHVLYEGWWAIRPQRGRDGMGTASIEIDTANNNGTRRFYRLRWVGYDSTLAAWVSRWEITTSAGQHIVLPAVNAADMTDNPAGSYMVAYNEAKPGWVYVAMEVDITTDKYLGVRVGTIGIGSLADTPDTSLEAYTGGASVLSGFGNGLNFGMTLENLPTTDSSQSMFIGRARATARSAA